MTEQDIERIVAACGYALHFRDEVGRYGDGTSRCYVIVREYGKGGRNRSLGRIEKVKALSQDDLVQLIQTKFAPKKDKE